VSKFIGPSRRVSRIDTSPRRDQEVAVPDVNFQVAVAGSFNAHDFSVSVAYGPADRFARHDPLLLQRRATQNIGRSDKKPLHGTV
jgi:hypothetical protein